MKLPAAFSPAVLAALAKPFMLFDPRNAELVPGVTPTWHVVETYERRERDVAQVLSGRRFGIYLPEEQQTIIRRGRKVDHLSLMFPGYLFLFVWNVLEHRERIEAVEGVLRVIMDVDGVPAVLTDEEVNEIRAVENGARRSELKKKRRGYSRRAYDNEVISVRPWSAFQDRLLTLDSEARNQTLRKALGLS